MWRGGALHVRGRAFAIVLAAATAVLWAAPGALASTITVTTTADSGAGSLRQAIVDANAMSDTDTIAFALSGPQTIQPLTALPPIVYPVTIDGSGDLDGNGNPNVRIDGGAATDGALYGLELRVPAPYVSTVEHLSLANWNRGGGAGIALDGTGAVTVTANLLGTDSTGIAALGGGAQITGNTIEDNVGDGVDVLPGGDGVTIRQNAIDGNGGLGIDLGAHDGVTANDEGDVDTGPNGLQNFPVLTSATAGAGTVQVSGSLDTNPGPSDVTVDFYVSPACDPSGNGEGAEWIGSVQSATDASGQLAIDTSIAASVTAGEAVTATATDNAGDTSEFSACVAVTSGSGSAPATDGVSAPASGHVFVVNSNASFGDTCTVSDCTLEAAVAAANATPNSGGPDTIDFALPAGQTTIDVGNPLTITDPVVIDGTTQSGYGGTPLVVVDGGHCDGCLSGDQSGIVVQSGSGSTIRGLAVIDFPGYGIEMDGGSTGTVVESTWIGLDPTGSTSLPWCADGGILIRDSAGNRIGGAAAAQRVIVAGNGNGGGTLPYDAAQIVITGAGSSGNAVQGSRIGLGPSGENYGTQDGVFVGDGASGNTIGGTAAGEGNAIGGLAGDAIDLDGAGTGNTLAGNLIGVTNTGDVRLRDGIAVNDTAGTVIGANVGPGGLDSIAAGSGNAIGGAGGAGILLTGSTTGTVVAGNYVGVDETGAPYPNATGIDAAGVSNNQIGPGNTVADNTSSGIVVDGGTGDRIVADSIHDNGGAGILLANGGNASLAAPTIVSLDGTTSTVAGTLGTTADYVELFESTACDTSGSGEGGRYVGYAVPTSGDWSATVTGLKAGEVVTATATDAANDTSGFSRCFTVGAATGPAPAAPILFGAVPDVGDGSHLGVAGLEQGSTGAGAGYVVDVSTAASCDATSWTSLGTATITTNENGIAAFAIGTFANVAAGQFVTATASQAGGTQSARSNCVRVGPNNTSWPTAATLAPDGGASGYLDSPGEGRWYKVPVLPNSRASVTLSGLPADYDLIVFGDVGAAYQALSGGDLSLEDLARQQASAPTDVFNTSEFDSSSWDPTNWDPTLNAALFSPSQWSPSQWSPSQWSPSQWSPSQWSPSQWSPSQWSSSQWSPSQWSPSQWSPSQWSPDGWASSYPSDPKAFSDAQTTSLLAVSAGPGTGDENVSVNTWNDTGYFYVRVQGKNGAYDATHPFTLTVSRQGSVCQGIVDQQSAPAAPASGANTLILVDRSRLATSTIDAKLAALAARPEVHGVVVDVGADPTVAALNAQADQHAACPFAKNLVAAAIKRIVDAYRADNPIEYVVIVGGDSAIPFYRYPDPSLLGSETLYSPPVLDASASQASLRLGYVLDQDYYGARSFVTLHGNRFPVPDLAVGRLVETPAEIGGMLDAYLGLSGGVVPTPTSSLVTGYDFLQDAADDVEANLSAGTGSPGDTLITNEGVSPATTTVNGTPDRDHSWTGDDLRKALLGSGRHDLIFLAGHFSANDALAADFKTDVLSTELAASSTDFANSIVFSAGCHSGYNIVNGDAIPNVTAPLDWAEAFASKQATLIAGTGYQYGDTDFLAYSERIYAGFSHDLRLTDDPGGAPVPVAVGPALVQSKLDYLSTTPVLSALDEKALLEATLFGLPMLSVDLPHGRIYQPSSTTQVGSIAPVGGGPGAALGLDVGDTSVGGPTGSGSVQMTNGPLATYLKGPDGVAVAPLQPVLPLVTENVTPPVGGFILRGVGLRSGSYSDEGGVTPLTGAPATELRGIHAPFTTDVFFPIQPYTANYYDTIGGGATRLQVTPVQHKSDSPTTSIRRTFSQLGFRLFYSKNLSAAALAAPPTITGVTASAAGGSLTVGAHVLGDPAAGIQDVWVTWTVPPASGGSGTWQSFDLTQDAHDPTLWSGSPPLGGADPAGVVFMVQAVNGVGRVTLDSNVGAYYRVGSIPGQTGATPPAATSIAFAPPSTATYGDDVTLTATLTQGGSPLVGKQVRFSLGPTSIPAQTGSDGVATASVHVALAPGTYTSSASFAGDAQDAASSSSASLGVDPRPTVLALSGTLGTQTVGAPLSILATLKTAGSPGTPLFQRAVFVVVTGTGGSGSGVQKTVAASTDPTGAVSVPASVLSGLPVGDYDVDAYYDMAPAPADDVDYGAAHDHATLSIEWPFTGFLAPVANLPTTNVVKAGRGVPVKFSLGGDRGLAIFAGGAPQTAAVDCSSGTATSDVQTTLAAGSSSLQYDAASGQYTYVWKTDSSWTGCRELRLGLVDGSVHTARFQFK